MIYFLLQNKLEQSQGYLSNNSTLSLPWIPICCLEWERKAWSYTACSKGIECRGAICVLQGTKELPYFAWLLKTHYLASASTSPRLDLQFPRAAHSSLGNTDNLENYFLYWTDISLLELPYLYSNPICMNSELTNLIWVTLTQPCIHSNLKHICEKPLFLLRLSWWLPLPRE